MNNNWFVKMFIEEGAIAKVPLKRRKIESRLKNLWNLYSSGEMPVNDYLYGVSRNIRME